MAKALRELSASAPGVPAERERAQALSEAQIDALFGAQRQHGTENDLVAIGAAALATVIGAWLASGS